VFAAMGRIVWATAAAMTVGAIVGSWIGARFALVRGQAWIRWIVVVMVIVTSVGVLLR
jgi:uncharacterized protein